MDKAKGCELKIKRCRKRIRNIKALIANPPTVFWMQHGKQKLLEEEKTLLKLEKQLQHLKQ